VLTTTFTSEENKSAASRNRWEKWGKATVAVVAAGGKSGQTAVAKGGEEVFFSHSGKGLSRGFWSETSAPFAFRLFFLILTHTKDANVQLSAQLHILAIKVGNKKDVGKRRLRKRIDAFLKRKCQFLSSEISAENIEKGILSKQKKNVLTYYLFLLAKAIEMGGKKQC